MRYNNVMPDFREELRKKDVLFFDGAMGTQLIERGFRIGECPESWNVTDKKGIVTQIHENYARAGCDVLETNSFGANTFRLGICGLVEKTYAINKTAAHLARKAAGKKKLVAGSIGPTGIFLKRKHPRREKEIMDAYLPQIQGLVDGGANVLCVETMMEIREASAIVKAVREVTATHPVIVTMTFKCSADGCFTPEGMNPKEAARALEKLNVDAIGTNCSSAIEHMIEIVRVMRKNSNLPILAQPTAGQPSVHGTKIFYPETPEKMARHVPQLIDAGAQLIGGCCGTTPEHLRAMIQAARRHKKGAFHEKRKH